MNVLPKFSFPFDISLVVQGLTPVEMKESREWLPREGLQ